MADHIGIDDPCRSRWKFPNCLATVRLECRIFFQEIMEAQHPLVVIGAAVGLDAERLRYKRRNDAPRFFVDIARMRSLILELRAQLFEGVGGSPHARAVRIYIFEHP